MTGYDEFRVIKVEISKDHHEKSENVELNFKSFSMAVVLEGHGEVEIEEYGIFKLEKYQSYYILPEKLLRINSTSKDENLVVFIANCDI